ncbi:unnamed protein product [Peronospora destructor]|uniref:START domain-containing protein n=1 Tax=Peronospora destructor TaxID=86335 RepID=A0AAV0TSS9_9STRA|nr:unnamed protein product [Peronospora destructor]
MLSVTSPRSSQSPPLWTAPPAASWTTEEISMIQQMFLSDDKTIQIQDISIYDSKQPVAEDLLAISVEQGADATSMLLSPIGADDAFLQQFMVDEKDAMTAFFLETIDPFKNVPRDARFHRAKSCLVSTGSISCNQPKRRSADQPRAGQATYKGCSASSRGLSTENARLKTDTTSCTQRCELLLQESSDGRAELEQLSQSIDESTYTTAVTEGMNLALNYSINGEVLRDHQGENGWRYKSVVSPDGMFTYSLSKEYPKEVNMREVMQKSWTSVSSSENFSSIYYGSIKAKLVKKVGKEAIIMYDIANYDATRVDRVVAVVFRVEIPDGFLLGVRSLDVPLTTTSKNIRRMDCMAWQRYECKEGGGFMVTSCGQLSYPSRADIDFMAMEIMCLHLRWESRVLGLQLIV